MPLSPSPSGTSRRDDLEAQRWRASFLADAGSALSASLNLRRTLHRVADLAMPTLGEWCGVHLVASGGLDVVYAGPPGQRIRSARMPLPTDTTRGVGRVLRTRRTVHLRGLTEAGVARVVLDAEERARLPRLPTTAVVAPLLARGDLLGALAVARDAPYDALDVELMDGLAQRAAVALDTARLYAERSQIARTLQDSLLPAQLPRVPGARLAARYRPAQESTEIGGDFYDVHRCADGAWSFVIGDVCGKGVEAAVLTGQARQAVRTAELVRDSPGGVLDLLNRSLLDLPDDRFATVVYGRLTPRDGGLRLTLANAGHPRPLVLRRNGTVQPVPGGGLVVGVFDGVAYDDLTVDLAAGEICLLYTDGVTEARVGDTQFDTDGLMRLLRSCAGMDVESLVARVEQVVLEWLAGRAHDDIAVLAVEAVGEDGQ